MHSHLFGMKTVYVSHFSTISSIIYLSLHFSLSLGVFCFYFFSLILITFFSGLVHARESIVGFELLLLLLIFVWSTSITATSVAVVGIVVVAVVDWRLADFFPRFSTLCEVDFLVRLLSVNWLLLALLSPLMRLPLEFNCWPLAGLSLLSMLHNLSILLLPSNMTGAPKKCAVFFRFSNISQMQICLVFYVLFSLSLRSQDSIACMCVVLRF